MHGMDWNDFNLATHPTTMHIWMAGNVQRVNIHFLAKAHQEQTKKSFFSPFLTLLTWKWSI